jgi:predicted metal-dependent peptidase
MTQDMPVAVRIRNARTALLLDHPFFGALLFHLKGRESRSISTMATDGASLYYNPDFVDTLNSATLAGVLAHEVMHPALQHHLRRCGRDLKRWNVACDHAINPLLLDAGLSLPEGVLVDNRFRGMSAERIYNLIEDEQDRDSPGEQSSGDDQPADGTPSENAGLEPEEKEADGKPSAPLTPGGIGQVIDANKQEDGEASTLAEQAREWQIAVEQAQSVARLAGKMPAGAVRTLEAAQAAKVDWRELLRRAWSDTIPADYSWTRPNRRHVWSGLYLPGVTCEGVGEIAIAVDCSGSVSARQLGLFEAEISSILAGQRPRQVHVLYFDAEVHRVDTYQEGETIALTPVGGGGTDFSPCFDWLRERGIVPQTLVFLTDLCGSFPNDTPPYPVIWASTENRRTPFGQVVCMEGA